MRIIDDISQGSVEWFAAKLGRVSSSSFSCVLAKGQGKTRRAYMYKLVAERITGIRVESYTSPAMEWGIETEDQARATYELIHNIDVKQVGLVERDDIVLSSPDSLVGDKGLLEIKCPNTTTFIEYKLENRLPPAYKPQVQGQLWVCEREWCDFVAFDPRVPQGFMSVRVERDDAYIKTLEKEVDIFVNEMLEVVEKLS